MSFNNYQKSLAVLLALLYLIIFTTSYNFFTFNFYQKTPNFFYPALKILKKQNYLKKYTLQKNSYIFINNMIFARQINSKIIHIYLNDANGTVLNFTTNKNNFYKYDAYGRILKNFYNHKNLDNPRKNNTFFYNSQRYSEHTNLQYLRSRFYYPYLKRFINQDTTLLINKFNYANVNPIVNIDPTGHMSCGCYFCSFLKDFFFNSFINPIKNIISGAATCEDAITITTMLTVPDSSLIATLENFTEKILLKTEVKSVARFAVLDLDETIWAAQEDLDGNLLNITVKENAHEALETLLRNNVPIMFNTFGTWTRETLEQYLPELRNQNYLLFNAVKGDAIRTKSQGILKYIHQYNEHSMTNKNEFIKFIFFDDNVKNLFEAREFFNDYRNVAKTLVHINIWEDQFPLEILSNWLNDKQLYFSHCIEQA